MAKLYGKTFTKEELLKRVGDISQIAGARKFELSEGREKGIEAVEFRTGTGFNFTVLPGRCMDISYAEYCGKPLCWRSCNGDVNASFYDPNGLNWLRSFPGGMMVTCGLTYVGAPCNDDGQELGIHGRIGNTPARNVIVDGKWEGDEYIMWAQGKMRQSMVFEENLQLTRKITAKLGESRFWIHDEVENMGYETQPLMIIYHINGGFPAMDGGTEFVGPSEKVTARDEFAKVDPEHYYRYEAPTPGFHERVYYHQMKADKDGIVTAALVNKNIEGGFGFAIHYRKDQLRNFTQWKMNAEGLYVAGVEPCNCGVEGRDVERKRGTLETIKPGEIRKFDVEIQVLKNLDEINEVESKIRAIQPRVEYK